MKTARTFLILLVAAALVAVPLWAVLHRRGGEEKPAAADEDEKKPDAELSHISKTEDGLTQIELSKETQERIALKTEPLVETTRQREFPAYGRVVDPSPLIALDGDLAAAEAALEASRAAAERTRTLFQSGQNVAQKAVETAEAQFRSDQTKAQTLRWRLALEWGESIGKLNAVERENLLGELVRLDAVFVRVDVAAGQTITEIPTSARVVMIGREDALMTSDTISPAAMVDPKTQAQGYMILIKHPAFSLRPGAAATAYFQLSDTAEKGVVIPRAAILRYNGAAWAYVKTDEEKFVRREVPLDRPAENGIFVTEGFAADENVVTTGAQSLLAEEFKSQSGGDAGD